jgi:hypothetical protein
LGKSVVCGPDLANFSDLTAELAEAGVLHQYPTAAQAFDGVLRLLETQREGQPMGDLAGAALQGPSCQIAAVLLQALDAGVQPLEPLDR